MIFLVRGSGEPQPSVVRADIELPYAEFYRVAVAYSKWLNTPVTPPKA